MGRGKGEGFFVKILLSRGRRKEVSYVGVWEDILEEGIV